VLCVQLVDVFVCVRNLVGNVCIIMAIVVVSCHSLFLPGISTFVPKVIPTSLSSSLELQYFPFYVRYSKYSCCFLFLFEIVVLAGCHLSCYFLCVFLSTGTLYMIKSALFVCWFVPIVRPFFLLLLSRSRKYVVMLFSLSISYFIFMCT